MIISIASVVVAITSPFFMFFGLYSGFEFTKEPNVYITIIVVAFAANGWFLLIMGFLERKFKWSEDEIEINDGLGKSFSIVRDCGNQVDASELADLIKRSDD